MKKNILVVWICINVFLLCGSRISGQGLDDLAGKTAKTILDYFSDKYNVKVAITNFENFSDLSELSIQNYYQLLVSKMETSTNIGFTDLMINFHQDKGEFNLNQIQTLNHLIYIRLIRNKTNIGAGVTIFSRTQDKVVFFKYLESEYVSGEETFINTVQSGFEGSGFSRIMELDSRGDLLDIRSITDSHGRVLLFFYYPEKIEFFRSEDNRLEKFYTYRIAWKKPYYPTMKKEGRLMVFQEGTDLYLSAGSNFSSYSVFVKIKDEKWEEPEIVSLNFVPLRRIKLNDMNYLAGIRYALGKNYFEGKWILAPLLPDTPISDTEGVLEKQVQPFYTSDYATQPADSQLMSIHMVDRDYIYRFFSNNFEQATAEKEERGSALCTLEGKWLAISNFSTGKDKLYFYRIESGSRQLVFENSIDGEVEFISDGIWKTAPGFWVQIKRLNRSSSTSAFKSPSNVKSEASAEYKLQFWSKKSE